MELSVKELSRSFGSKDVLSGISFSLKGGECVHLQGANGSGKSTLLRILATLITPSSGIIQLEGKSINEIRRLYQRVLGYAQTSDNGFSARLTGFENLRFFSSLRSMSESELKSAIENWKSVEVFKKALETPFYKCSSGMKRSLTLFRSMMNNPKILLLDEPFNNLSPETINEVSPILFTGSSRLVIFTTHGEEATYKTKTFRLNEMGGLDVLGH